MAANDAAEARAMELSLQYVVKEEYARSLAEAQRQTHQVLNEARAASHHHLVQATFRWAEGARELERLYREAVA